MQDQGFCFLFLFFDAKESFYSLPHSGTGAALGPMHWLVGLFVPS